MPNTAQQTTGIQFSALAEVIEPRPRTRLTCRATDLSLGGSYADTISPFAVGTAVLVRLSCEGRSFQTGARVTYALNGMGMGLAFTPEMPAEQAAALHSWIAELSGDFQAAPNDERSNPPLRCQQRGRRTSSSAIAGRYIESGGEKSPGTWSKCSCTSRF